MTRRRPAPTLFGRLTANPADFDTVTALRVAEAEAKARGVPLLVRARPETRLQPLAVDRVTADDKAVSVDSHLFSYLGPLSPLPPGYAEVAAQDRRRRAGGFAGFFDLFTDRLTWLFVAASEKYDLAALLCWSRPADNAILTALRALLGFSGREAETPLPDDEVLRFSGLLAQRTRSGEGLRAMAQAELGLPVRLEQFRLVWRDIPVNERSRFDRRMQLGGNATAGSKSPDRAGQCRLVVGPVRYLDFLSLEKEQPRMDRLLRLVRHYVPPGIDFDVQIVLDRRDIPEARMGDALPPRLGWNSWVRIAPAANDSGAAVIRPDNLDGGANAGAA
ncbi:type VI secretion system baseplate subunit TssG [Paracoccus sp. (in: a-proteobacteria)]|uniref:type VI secretion system baseplate subunit TssG n=1 Tax=Paracoccus sp. TaxID=267 RepID=UPI003A8BAF4E